MGRSTSSDRPRCLGRRRLWSRSSTASPSARTRWSNLGQPPKQEAPLSIVLDKIERSSVSRCRILCQADPAQEICSGRRQEVVLTQRALVEGVECCQSSLGAVAHCQRDCSVELDHGRSGREGHRTPRSAPNRSFTRCQLRRAGQQLPPEGRTGRGSPNSSPC